MQELTELAHKLKTVLEIKYDGDGVKFLEGFIERNKSVIAEEEWNGLINSCGAFLGQCIIENYGGQWLEEPDGNVTIAFDDDNKVYPFSKVMKQFENGLEDSIHSMFTIIPIVYSLQPKPKKKWWKF